MARMLLKVPSLKRMISSPRTEKLSDFNACSTSSVAEKGHFFVYTSEGKRFMVPLAYLNNNIFKELLKISEEEFGLPSDGPITLPCDEASMEYVLSMLRRGVSEEVERVYVANEELIVFNDRNNYELIHLILFADVLAAHGRKNPPLFLYYRDLERPRWLMEVKDRVGLKF